MNFMRMTPFLLAIIITACSSNPKTTTVAEVEEDKILSRIDSLSSRPAWLKESEPFRIESGEVISLGQTTIPGNNRVEAAFRIAENNAKRNIATSIEQKLSFVFQNAEEGTGLDETQARAIGGEVSNITTSSLKPGQYYWEKVATTQESGQRVIQYKVFATVKMSEAEFKKSVIAAAAKREGKGGLSADFSKKVDKEWDKLVESKE